MYPEEIEIAKQLMTAWYWTNGLLMFIAVYIVLRDVMKYIKSWFNFW